MVFLPEIISGAMVHACVAMRAWGLADLSPDGIIPKREPANTLPITPILGVPHWLPPILDGLNSSRYHR